MLGKILGGLAALVVIIIALGFVLPDKVHVEREIVIDAPREEVFALISDFEAWDAWSPWADLDPDAEYSYTGEGVGQKMVWTSDDPRVGTGSQEITAMEPPERLVTHLDFGANGAADATFLLMPEAGGRTRALWFFDARMREGVPVHMKPVGTYMGYFMDGWVGPDYERGLENLKEVAERG